MPDGGLPQQQLLEDCMRLALQGFQEPAKKFFAEFLLATLHIPERRQEITLSHAPPYPNDFVSILGIQDKDRVIVPAFTETDYIEEWFGNPLLFRSISGAQLLHVIPDNWWICLNPGREVEKEISPWEISHLRVGPEGIEEIIAEIFDQGPIEALEVHPAGENEYPELVKNMRAHAATDARIKKLFLLREEGRNTEGQKTYTALLGVLSSAMPPDAIESLREDMLALAEKSLLGADYVKVFAGVSVEDSISLGIFKGCLAFYTAASAQQSTSLPARIWRKIRTF